VVLVALQEWVKSKKIFNSSKEKLAKSLSLTNFKQ